MIVHGSVTYSRVTTLADAVVALRRPGACPYAGGTDLIVALQGGATWTDGIRELVDIKAIAEAQGITRDGGEIRIGALTTAAALASSAVVRRELPALAQAARVTSAPLLRRRGTVGGNLVTRHPAPDVCTALLALRAAVEVVTSRGVIRRLPVEHFLERRVSSGTTPLVLAVHVALARSSAYEKLAERRGFARALVAAGVARHGRRVTVSLGGIADRPFAARFDAAALAGALPALLLAAFAPLGDMSDAKRRATLALVRRVMEGAA